MIAGETLPWALDTLDIGGEIRAKYIRLQNWAATLLSGANQDEETK